MSPHQPVEWAKPPFQPILQIPARPHAEQRRDLVVLSANLWHDWPRRRRLPERMECFARLIEAEGADVVLVQEVVRTSDQHMDRWLAERLGMSFSYTRANGHNESIGFEEGLAIYSRFPVVSSRSRRLQPRLSRFVNRLALGAELTTPHGDFWVFSVHLGLLRTQNAAQLRDLRAWVDSVAGAQSAVVGGDFNAPEHAPHMQDARRHWLDAFRSLHPQADATTHTLRWPWGKPLRHSRLDYLFLRGAEPDWQVVEARHLDGEAAPLSDHRAVVVRLSPRDLSPAAQHPGTPPSAQQIRGSSSPLNSTNA